MYKIYSPPLVRSLRTGLFATVAALCLFCITVTATFASTVNIYDNAGVLNQSQVRSEASSLSYPIDIYTTNNYTGSKSAFDQTTASKVNKTNLIVIAIDTVQHHLAIVGGRGVNLSSSQYTDARNAFASNFHNNDYTGATIAAIDSLRSASSGGMSVPGITGAGGGGIGFGTICCIGLLVLAALAVFGVIRGRRRGGGFFNRGFSRGPVTPPYDPNYNQYNQPYPPYGPGYPQNQGMNPLAAGGLGAAAGGLLGYELGKQQGEREGDRGDGGFGGGSSGDFGGNNDGGFGGGDFGGGSSGDFGGGGGGDFGGGSSGDFGGGGGGDFGGGSSGDF